MERQLVEKIRQGIIRDSQNCGCWEECIFEMPVEYRVFMELPEDVKKSERAMGIMIREKLKALRFFSEKGENIVGRLAACEGGTAELREKGRAFFWGKEAPWNASMGQSGHCAPDYETLLDLGVDGLRRRVQEAQAKNPLPLHENMLDVLDGFEQMILHGADAASNAGNEELAQICRKLSHETPSTFLEGLQLILFAQIAIEKGERAYLINPGRLDRLLARFLPVASHEKMVEELTCFYLCLNANCPSGLAYGLMICGDTPANEISYACLEASRCSRLTYPTIGICVNKETPEDLMNLAVSIVADGNPNPAFFGDETIRKGLESYGVPHDDSGNYVNSTCVEITPCGQSNVYVASPYFNLSQMLLDALDKEYASFEELIDGFHARLAEKIRQDYECVENARNDRARRMRRPLLSLLTRDCLKNNLDIECGGARYNWVECSFVGMANLVDSLTVIKNEVFEKKRHTIADIKQLCVNDFQGAEAERRQFLHDYPKYGQDCPDVDGLIAPTIRFIRDELAKYHFSPGNSPWIPGTFCWINHQLLGAQTCATPDGRRAGFPFADGAGPAQGRETLGPTTAIRSVTSWDHSPLIGGSAFNMKFSKSTIGTPEAQGKLKALIKTFIQQGGFETQINVVDAETLVDADRHPENYSDLMVRIGGYSDFFTKLSPAMRQEVIMRTQNSL